MCGSMSCRALRLTRRYIDEFGNDFAKRHMDKKYGEGNYKTGPNSEYSKLKRYADRHFE